MATDVDSVLKTLRATQTYDYLRVGANVTLLQFLSKTNSRSRMLTRFARLGLHRMELDSALLVMGGSHTTFLCQTRLRATLLCSHRVLRCGFMF